MSISIRKCIACSEQMPKTQLIRIVHTADDKFILDTSMIAEGRGYYVCPSSQCILNLKEKALLNKATGLSVDPQLYLDIANAYKQVKKNNISALIGFATRSNKLVIGMTAVERYTLKNKIHLILMEKATKKNTRNNIYSLYKRHKIPFYIYEEEQSLEQITGRANCKCIGITDRDFSRQLIREINRKPVKENQ